MTEPKPLHEAADSGAPASGIASALKALDQLALSLLRTPFARLSRGEKRVLLKIAKEEASARDPEQLHAEESDFWDRLADRVAAIGGSWRFIFCFAAALVGWMLLNSDILQRFGLAFDPYPYIFLNLLLSTIAAIQAPVIMMSQNRQSARDRLAAQTDFEVNLRAELEIMRLHDKLDALRADALEAGLAEIRAELSALRGVLTARDGAAR